MRKVILKILPVCFFSTSLFGQNDSIKVTEVDRYVNQAVVSQIKVDSLIFIIDSIQVSEIKYENTIVTKSLFKESKTSLTTIFYLKDNKIIFGKIMEPATSKGFEKMYRYCDFNFKDNNMVLERCRATRQLGVAINVDGTNSNIYGYNESLSVDFLEKYIAILYNRVQNYR